MTSNSILRSRILCSGIAFLFLMTFVVPAPLAHAHADDLLGTFSSDESLLPTDDALHHEEDAAQLVVTDTTLGFLQDDSPLSASDPEFGKPQNPGNGNGNGGGNTGGGETSGPKIRRVKNETPTDSAVTITWVTSAPADSQVEFGTADTYGSFSALDSTLVTDHSVSLDNLQPDTLYHFRALSRDDLGNLTQSGDYTFTTAPAPDTVPPVISNVHTNNVTDTSITILWNTDEPADARVEYGLTTSYGSSSALDSSLGTQQSITLTGLSADKQYHYRAISRDSQGNETVTGDFTFTTLPPAPAEPATVFLDFDGTYLATWGSYSNLTIPSFNTDSDPNSFNASEQSVIDHVLSAVMEKFSIFNVFVTLLDPFVPQVIYSSETEEFQARDAYYEANHILQVAIGGSSGAVLGISAGGVAYVNSFTNYLENTVLVFPGSLANTDRYIWEASAHETGHGFGLQHQSTYDSSGTKTNEYNPGSGGVAPIMGNSYNKRGLWWEGTSSISSTSIQNDMEVIARDFNGFGYRPDEFGDTPLSAAAFPDVFGTSFGGYGVINNTADADYFEFTLADAGAVNFSASVNPYGAMLDLTLEIRDASDNLVVAADTSSLGETLSNVNLAAGEYYLVVRSKAAYIGDVGQYWIDGTVPVGTTTTAGPNAPSGPATTSSSQTGGSGPAAAAFGLPLSPYSARVYVPVNYFAIFPQEPAHTSSAFDRVMDPMKWTKHAKEDNRQTPVYKNASSESVRTLLYAAAVTLLPETPAVLPTMMSAAEQTVSPEPVKAVSVKTDKIQAKTEVSEVPARKITRTEHKAKPGSPQELKERLLRLLTFFPAVLPAEIIVWLEGK